MNNVQVYVSERGQLIRDNDHVCRTLRHLDVIGAWLHELEEDRRCLEMKKIACSTYPLSPSSSSPSPSCSLLSDTEREEQRLRAQMELLAVKEFAEACALCIDDLCVRCLDASLINIAKEVDASSYCVHSCRQCTRRLALGKKRCMRCKGVCHKCCPFWGRRTIGKRSATDVGEVKSMAHLLCVDWKLREGDERAVEEVLLGELDPKSSPEPVVRLCDACAQTCLHAHRHRVPEHLQCYLYVLLDGLYCYDVATRRMDGSFGDRVRSAVKTTVEMWKEHKNKLPWTKQ